MPDGIGSTAISDEVAKINKLIPVKTGTTLTQIGSDEIVEKSIKTGDQGFPDPNQTQGYIRPASKERFDRYLDRMFKTGLIGVGASSIVQQISENPPEWEQNGKGLLRRVGSNFAGNVIEESIAYGLEESLKLDSKFYKSKKRDFGSRVKMHFSQVLLPGQRTEKEFLIPHGSHGDIQQTLLRQKLGFPTGSATKMVYGREQEELVLTSGLTLSGNLFFQNK